MKKTIVLLLTFITLFLLFCKEETPVENDPWLNNFDGKIYVILDSQKVYVENVKIFLNGDSTFTNSEGYFSFEEVPNGEYIVAFLFTSSSHPFVRNKSLSIISNQENKTEEYLVYQEAVFKGKVYTEIDNERINIENAKIYFLGDSTTTDIDGKFSFNYEFSLYEGRNIRFNIIYNENYFDGNKTILIENPYHYNEYYLSPKISLKLEIFTIKESEKLVLNEASVRLNGEILKQDDAGRYYKNDIKYGSYKLSINYPGLYPIYDSLNLNSIKNEYSYEMTNILDEDIIYVQNDNYYFRNANGERIQITYTNDRIGDEVSFFNDGNRFVYISVAGESHYSINFISLNPTMYHRVIYEFDEQIQDIRITEDETNICFIQNDKIMRIDINGGSVEILYTLPNYSSILLFHDCERFAYSHQIMEFQYLVIKNFVTGDSTENSLSDTGFGSMAISPNDELLYYILWMDGSPHGSLINTVNGAYIKSFDGALFGNFTECGNYLFGMEFNWKSLGAIELTDAKIYRLPSFEEIILETDLDYRDGFNTLSYSEKSNKYLYSLNGDIKVYDVNSGKSYNFIATNDSEYAARFVNVK